MHFLQMDELIGLEAEVVLSLVCLLNPLLYLLICELTFFLVDLNYHEMRQMKNTNSITYITLLDFFRKMVKIYKFLTFGEFLPDSISESLPLLWKLLLEIFVLLYDW